jgi:S-phase kinase-associated protein 1
VKEKEDTAGATEGAGEKTVFFFSAAAAGKMITLASSEGQLFRMSEAAARLSVVLADMIDNGCASGNIPLPNVDDRALAMVIKYCDKHAGAEPDSNHGAADEGSSSSANTAASTNTAASKKALDAWDRKLVEDLTQDALFDLITAANFLDIKGLLQASCQKVADMIVNKTPAQVRTMFSIANDFTAEEEEEIRKESPSEMHHRFSSCRQVYLSRP